MSVNKGVDDKRVCIYSIQVSIVRSIVRIGHLGQIGSSRYAVAGTFSQNRRRREAVLYTGAFIQRSDSEKVRERFSVVLKYFI